MTLLIPHRRCACCSTPHAVATMALIRRAWWCTACVRGQLHRRRQQPAEEATANSDVARSFASEAASRLTDFGPALGRAAAYGILFLLATRYPLAHGLLTGSLIADLVTWAAAIVGTAARGSFVVLADVCVFMVAGALWTHVGGGTTLPDDPSARATAMLTALVVFFAKTLRFVRALRD